VIDMELLSVIRRWHYRDHFSIREISRRTGLSRNTVRKYLRSDSEEPKFILALRRQGCLRVGDHSCRVPSTVPPRGPSRTVRRAPERSPAGKGKRRSSIRLPGTTTQGFKP
jgi:predicted transcriptional regulator